LPRAQLLRRLLVREVRAVNQISDQVVAR
jgi:hypothetical protein